MLHWSLWAAQVTWDSNSLGPTKKTLLKLVCDQLPNTMVEFYRQYNLIQDGKYYWLMAFTMDSWKSAAFEWFEWISYFVQCVSLKVIWSHTNCQTWSYQIEGISWISFDPFCIGLSVYPWFSSFQRLWNTTFGDVRWSKDGIQRTNAALMMSGSWTAGKSGATGAGPSSHSDGIKQLWNVPLYGKCHNIIVTILYKFQTTIHHSNFHTGSRSSFCWSCRIMLHFLPLKTKVRGTVDFNEVQIVPSRHGNAESREAIRTTGLVARRRANGEPRAWGH